MKKILLGTTALVGAAAVAASSATAMPLQSFGDEGKPILTASIVMQFEAGIADNDKPNGQDVIGTTNGKRDGKFVGGRFAEIWFQGELTADNGLTYGARISLAADQPTRTNTYPGRKYIYLSGGWGSLELGDWIGPSSVLSISAMAQEVSGNGMFDHAATEYIKTPNSGLTTMGDFQVNNGSYIGWFLTDFGTKVSYYTPVIAGFQAGVSYSPTSDNVGQSLSNRGGANAALNNNGGGATNFSDVVGVGVRYDGEAGDLTYAAAFTATWGNADDTTACGALAGGATAGACNPLSLDRDDLQSWNVGAKVGFAGFTLAGNYYDDDGSGYRKIEQAQVDGWTMVGTYEFGPYKVGLNYMKMDIEHNALWASRTGFGGTGGTPGAPVAPRVAINAFAAPAALVAGTAGVTGDRTRVQDYEYEGIGGGFGYQMAPGLKLYVDVGHFEFDTPIPELDNSGIVAYGGIYVSF